MRELSFPIQPSPTASIGASELYIFVNDNLVRIEKLDSYVGRCDFQHLKHTHTI